MRYFNWFMQKLLHTAMPLVRAKMMLAILTALSREKIRLYTVRNRGLSLHQPRILPTWYDRKKAIMSRKPNKELVYVDIPMSLLFNGDTPDYNARHGCYVYHLKGTGLRYAKRSCRKFRQESA